MFARRETEGDDHETIGGGGGHGGGGAMGRMSTLGVVPGNDGIRRARDSIQSILNVTKNVVLLCQMNQKL